MKINKIGFKRFEKPPTMEQWFVFYMDQLKEAGYIKEYRIGKDVNSFLLTEPKTLTYTYDLILHKGRKNERTRKAERTKKILNGSTYRPDAFIVWDESAKNIFFTDSRFVQGIVEDITPFTGHLNKEEGLHVSWVDVKSPYKGKNCSDATFSLNRKIVLEKHGIFVDKAILMPNKRLKPGKPGEYVFARTFTPDRFFFTDKNLDFRSIKYWETRTLDDFIKKIEEARK